MTDLLLATRWVKEAAILFAAGGWSDEGRLTHRGAIESLAAPRVTLELVITILAIGSVIRRPSFASLYRVFKSGETAFEQDER